MPAARGASAKKSIRFPWRGDGMSRSISIGYQHDGSGPVIDIEVRPPYYLLGTQQTSKRFWSIPKLREIGITELTELGVTDPVNFYGWDMMAELGREIMLLEQNLESIEFASEIKAQWLSHLVYCYYLLVQTAPKGSVPVFMIG
jgi:hypothetical protein